MKIFYDNGNGYVWEKVSSIDKDRWEFVLNSSDGYEKRVPFGKVRSVKNDIRKKYIWCNSCNEMIKLKPHQSEADAMSEHFKSKESRVDCMKCSYFTVRDTRQTKKTTKMLPDGNVLEVIKNIGRPKCSVSYRALTPDDAKGNGCCQFFACRIKNRYTSFLNSVYVKYPKMLETILTISAFNKAKKWRFIYCCDDFIKYSYNNVNAILNKNGEFRNFQIEKRGRGTLMFFYSPEYDKFFSVDRSWRKTYEIGEDELKTYWLKSGRGDAIITEIKNLYK